MANCGKVLRLGFPTTRALGDTGVPVEEQAPGLAVEIAHENAVGAVAGAQPNRIPQPPAPILPSPAFNLRSPHST